MQPTAPVIESARLMRDVRRPSVNDWLWTELHYFFDTDDGSLPRVCLDYQDKRAVVGAFKYLRTRGQDVTYQGATFWSVTHARDRPLDSVPNAAVLVVSGDAHAFHFLLRGIEVDGIRLPDLGVFLFDEGIELDYRMGPEWRSAEVVAFFRLLLNLASLDPNASLTLQDHVPPEVVAQFQRCWRRFVDA
jgi:hypothetical protein